MSQGLTIQIIENDKSGAGLSYSAVRKGGTTSEKEARKRYGCNFNHLAQKDSGRIEILKEGIDANLECSACVNINITTKRINFAALCSRVDIEDFFEENENPDIAKEDIDLYNSSFEEFEIIADNLEYSDEVILKNEPDTVYTVRIL